MNRAGFLFFRLLRLLYYPTTTGCIAREVEPVLHVVDVGHEAADLEQAHHDRHVFVVEVVCVVGAFAVAQINIPQRGDHSEVILSVAVRDIAIFADQLFYFVQKLGADVGIGWRDTFAGFLDPFVVWEVHLRLMCYLDIVRHWTVWLHSIRCCFL